MIGYDIIAYGNEWIVDRSTNIHKIDPIKYDKNPNNKYIWVDLDRSNLRKYDNNNPGNTIAVIGNHAHFLYN